MSSESKGNLSSQSEGNFRGTTESPTTPGAYWYRRDAMSSAIMVELRLTNGELMVWWPPKQDEPVANLKGHWRGPIAPSMGPGSR
jgi:hypothetical protein